jgi:hypothetical protein
MEKLIVTTETELSNLIESSLNKIFLEQSNRIAQKDSYPEFLNINQAAIFLDLAKQTLYGFTSKGLIPHLKRGKKLYFKKSQLINWLVEGNSKAIDSKADILTRNKSSENGKSK